MTDEGSVMLMILVALTILIFTIGAPIRLYLERKGRRD